MTADKNELSPVVEQECRKRKSLTLAELMLIDPKLEVGWRYNRASELVEEDPLLRRQPIDDDLTYRAATFLKRRIQILMTGGDQAEMRRRRHADDPELYLLEILESSERLLILRRSVRMRILAGETDEQIAAETGLTAQIVALYHDLYFWVRPKLKVIDAIAIFVLGDCNLPVDLIMPRKLLAFWAYACGPATVNYFLEVSKYVPLEGGIRDMQKAAHEVKLQGNRRLAALEARALGKQLVESLYVPVLCRPAKIRKVKLCRPIGRSLQERTIFRPSKVIGNPLLRRRSMIRSGSKAGRLGHRLQELPSRKLSRSSDWEDLDGAFEQSTTFECKRSPTLFWSHGFASGAYHGRSRVKAANHSGKGGAKREGAARLKRMPSRPKRRRLRVGLAA